MHENTEYDLVLKWQEKRKHYQSSTGFLKCIRIQQVHVSSLHVKYALQNNFLNFYQIYKNFVLQTSDAINIKTLAKSIAVYDFSTLYTKRSHDQLKSKLSFMVDFALKRGDKTFIRLSNNGAAYWGRKKGDLVLVKHNLEQL